MATATMEAPKRTGQAPSEAPVSTGKAPAMVVEVYGETCEARDAEAFLVEREAFCDEKGADVARNYRLPAKPVVFPTDKPAVQIEKQQKYEADLRDVPVNVPVQRSHGWSNRQPGFYVVRHQHIWRLNFRVCAPNHEDSAGTQWEGPFYTLAEAHEAAGEIKSPYPVGKAHKVA